MVRVIFEIVKLSYFMLIILRPPHKLFVEHIGNNKPEYYQPS